MSFFLLCDQRLSLEKMDCSSSFFTSWIPERTKDLSGLHQ